MISRHLQKILFSTLPVSLLRKQSMRGRWHANPDHKQQLLVDVSAIAHSDAKTGIQRVVRNLYQKLLLAPPEGYRICPVMATRKQFYRHVPVDFLRQPSSALISSAPLCINAGDIFLGLDLSAHLIPHHLSEMAAWKKQGVRMSFVIYDLLPVLHPQWFNPRATQNFHKWLRAIALFADNAIVTSHAVQSDFYAWMQRHFGLSKSDIPCAVIPLGAELDNSFNEPQTDNRSIVLPPPIQSPFILMVGTIEPRKGYADALDAFEQLWNTGNLTQLVIVGKHGWKVEALVQRLKTHPEAGNRLIWLDKVDDVLLRTLYEQCQGVLMASKGEGYGLPLVEAAHFNKPLLVRDIPVFREIAGDAASYFPNTTHNSLIEVLPQWLLNQETTGKTAHYPFGVTWQKSCAQLVKALIPENRETGQESEQFSQQYATRVE